MAESLVISIIYHPFFDFFLIFSDFCAILLYNEKAFVYAASLSQKEEERQL